MNELTRLQPLYTEMIKNTNKETVKRVHDELKKTNAVNLQQLQDYVLLPIISKIDSDTLKNKEIVVELIVTLKNLLDATTITKLIPLKIIVVVLLKQVFDMESSTIKANLSEELKSAVVECFDVAFRKSTFDVKSEFYVPQSRSLIGQIVFACVNIIEKETYKALRMSSINCLLATLYIYDGADFSDIVLRDQVSNEVYIMTPKVLSVLKSIALGDDKLGHSLISLSVQAIGRFLCLIFEDYNRISTAQDLTIENFKALINKDANESSVPSNVNILNVKTNTTSPKTDDWLHAAIRKITPTVEDLKKLIGNKNPKIRIELARMSISLLQKCLKFMQPCVSQLVEIILALSQDEDQTISEICETTIRTTLQEIEFHDIVEQIFITHIIRLPLIIAVGDEDEQTAAMLLLKGLLQSLRSTHLKIILANRDTLGRFTTVLLSAAELKRDMSLLLEEHTVRNFDENIEYVFVSPWKQFKNLRNQTIIDHFESFCELIGASNASDLVVGYLLELFSTDLSSCNEVIVLLQFILSVNGHKTSVCNCLEDFLTDNHWHLATQANKTTKLEMEEFGHTDWYEDRTEGLYESAISVRYTDVRWKGSDYLNISGDEITIADAMFNVLHTSLVLETIGRFAFVLQRDFQPFLFRSLHRILEKCGLADMSVDRINICQKIWKIVSLLYLPCHSYLTILSILLGSSNYAIHSAGLFALNQLKVGFSYDSIPDLIHENSDYISYFVKLSLKKVNQSQTALDILSVVLKYSSLNSIPHLENVIATVLSESSKNVQNANVSSFLKVFKMILLRINEWNVPTEPLLNDESIDSTDNELELRKNWLKIFNPIEDEFDDATRETVVDETKFKEEQEQKLNTDYEAETESEAKEVLPSYIDVTIQIMSRCIKYMSSKSQMDKCTVIEAIECGLNVLKTRENQLLPMFHSIWKPFVERFKENDPIVLRRYFKLLIKLGELSKDFIYQRMAKDVLPFILTFLKSSGSRSINVKDMTYEHSQQFKLQMELLQTLPSLLIATEIVEKDVNSVLEAVLPYCRKDQHKVLQENCVKFLAKLSIYDATAVYVKLLNYQDDNCYKENVNKVFNLL